MTDQGKPSAERCKHADGTVPYIGTYGSLLGGCCPCHRNAMAGSDYCIEHSTEEKRKLSQQEYEDRYGIYSR